MVHAQVSQRVSRKYDLLAPMYDCIWRHYSRKTVEKALAAARLTGDETILDIGCGTGALEAKLLKECCGHRIYACDVSPASVHRAIHKTDDDERVTFAIGDFLNLEIPRWQFDVIFSLSNLHYFANPEQILRKTYSLAKPDARLVLVDWCCQSLRARFYQAVLGRVDKGFQRIYSLAEMKDLFLRTGWVVEDEDFFSIRSYWTMVAIRAKRR